MIGTRIDCFRMMSANNIKMVAATKMLVIMEMASPISGGMIFTFIGVRFLAES